MILTSSDNVCFVANIANMSFECPIWAREIKGMSCASATERQVAFRQDLHLSDLRFVKSPTNSEAIFQHD